MSPSDKYNQDGWTAVIYSYGFGSFIFLIILVGIAFYIGSSAKRTKNVEQKKKLYLARKVVLYGGIIGWLVFTGIIFGIIPTGI